MRTVLALVALFNALVRSIEVNFMLLQTGTYLGEIKREFENQNLKVTITHHINQAMTSYHRHENSYISILLFGEYVEHANNVQQKLQPGQFIYRPSNYVHANEFATNRCICLNLEIKPAFFSSEKVVPRFPETVQIYRPGQFNTLDLIVHRLANDIFDYEKLLLHWCANVAKKNFMKEGRVVSRAKELIEEQSPLHSLTTVANELSVHPVYLARVFKSATGTSVGEYIRRKKVERSLYLLFNTNLSVSSIAYELNFFDSAHFIKTFRDFYKLTPYQYRLSLEKLSW